MQNSLFRRLLRNIWFKFLANIKIREFKKRSNFQYTVYSQIMTSHLTLLSQKYGTDKGSYNLQNPYPWSPHSYTKYYEILFSNNRDNVRKVFECGIGSVDETLVSNMTTSGKSGASLRMWKDYFPNAQIFGADIDSKVMFSEERIFTYTMDQTNPKSIIDFWEKVQVEDFDLIIDDGLHTYSAGITLFENSFHKLKEGGWYVIEDVNVYDLIRYQNYFMDKDMNVNFVNLYFGKNKVSDDCLISISKSGVI